MEITSANECGAPVDFVDFNTEYPHAADERVASSARESLSEVKAGGSAYAKGKIDSDGDWAVEGGITIDFA